jgi:hypothetical protein
MLFWLSSGFARPSESDVRRRSVLASLSRSQSHLDSRRDRPPRLDSTRPPLTTSSCIYLQSRLSSPLLSPSPRILSRPTLSSQTQFPVEQVP